MEVGASGALPRTLSVWTRSRHLVDLLLQLKLHDVPSYCNDRLLSAKQGAAGSEDGDPDSVTRRETAVMPSAFLVRLAVIQSRTRAFSLLGDGDSEVRRRLACGVGDDHDDASLAVRS